MPEYWLYAIPTKPTFVPEESARREARSVFEQFVYPPNFARGLLRRIKDKVSDEVEFVDGGRYLDKVLCPRCGENVRDPWWLQWLGEMGGVGYQDFRATVPCCGVAYAMNDLIYDPSAGWARYLLGALYPSIDSLTLSQLDELGSILGCYMRQIWKKL